jgi:hypothetical protein
VVEKNQGHHLKEGHPLKELESQPKKYKHEQPKILVQNRLAYLAGVFDGEGSFGLWSQGSKRTDRIFQIQVEMRDIDIVAKFQEFFACGTIQYRAPRTENAEATHVWRCKGVKGLECAKAMMIFWGERRMTKMIKILTELKQDIPQPR